jgi:signal transduction histidine kinase
MPSRLKVLIVDDDADTCSSVCRILSLDGIDADIAHSVAELNNSRVWTDYFAVLLDRKLPDGTLEELLPSIRYKAPNAAVIIITGWADLENSIASFRAGAEDYIIKPLDPTTLRSTLERIRRNREAELKALQAERLAVIGQVVASVAHESRNYLQIICNTAEMIADLEDQSPETLQGIAVIQEAEQGLERLLEELRQFAAPLELEKNRDSLQRVWRTAWTDIAKIKKTDNAQIDEIVGDAKVHFPMDAFRMGQVFRNLFANSIEACGENARLQIRCEARNGTLKIFVRDNGPGLNREQRENVFRPFFTTKSNGTGLGMAIVKRIVEAHGGDIQVGDCDDGALFIIGLPLE